MVAALVLTAGCGGDDDPNTFSWTLHDSQRWGTCVDDALGSGSRTESSVRKAAEDCVRNLRSDVSAHAAVFSDCAAATFQSNASADGLEFTLGLDECLDYSRRQGL